MYSPKYNYSDLLVSNLIRIESLKTSLAYLDLAYNVKHKIGIQMKTYDIFHLSHMIDVELTLKEAERIAMGNKPEGLSDERSWIITNFRNALEFNRSNIADTYGEFDFTILLHLNKLILASWRETWDARFRTSGDSINTKWDELSMLRDVEIPDDEIEKEVLNLVEWYKASSAIIPPVIRLAIVFYRLIQLSPFISGNKYTIIAIMDYLFIKQGMGNRIHTSVIKMIDQNLPKLTDAFRIAEKNHSLDYWLESFTEMMIVELTGAREGINEYVLEEEKSKKQPFLDMNKRQLKVLRYLQNVPTIRREDYCHMMEVSTMTAFRDLNELVRKKLLKVDGKGRGTKYRLSSM